MAKKVDSTVPDAALAQVALCTTMHVCSAEPANHAGIAAVSLADVTLTAGDGNGDYVIGAGDVSGRKIRVGAQTGVTVDNSGTATHVVLTNGTIMKLCTTCTSQALTAANTVDIPAFDLEYTTPT